MTDHERQLRRKDRIRLGAILALFLLGAVPVVVAFAASPDPSSSGAAPTATTEAPAATTTPATTAPDAPKTPSVQRQDVKQGKGGRGFGGFGQISITAINGSSLSLKTDDGWTRTITVASDTKITKAGQAITLGDLAVGDHIRFAQKKNDDGTYTVTAIAVPVDHVSGEVTAVSGNTVTLKRRNGETQSVTLTGSTKYSVGRTAGAKSDVTVGSRVEVAGEASGSSFTALAVTVQPTLVAGEVTAKTSNSITLKRRDGTSVTVHVSADTKFGVRGSKSATIADIAVGDTVWASGKSRSDGSLDANAVAKGFSFGRGKGDHKGDAPKPGATAAPSGSQG